MAASVAISKGLALATAPTAAGRNRSSLGALNCSAARPAQCFRSPFLPSKTASTHFRVAVESIGRGQRPSLRVRCTAERVQAEKEVVQEVSSSSSGLPVGLTLSSAVCFLELLSAGAAEAKHPPQVDAAAFFTNLDVNGLFEFGFTSVGFLVFYFLVMPPILLTYFLKRWKKKQLAETFFIFSMVFVFFPGLMLWAPFINTRPFARSTGRYTAETDKAAFRGEDWRQ